MPPETTDSTSYVRKTITVLLSNDRMFERSALGSFKQFDVNNNGKLNQTEVELFFMKLGRNLSLPPLNDAMIHALVEKHDTSHSMTLNAADFCKMYKSVLQRIRDRFYPPTLETIRSTLFIPKCTVSTITEHLSFEIRLGSGSFGEVHRVLDTRCAKRRACKIINKSKIEMPVEQVGEEIRILKSVDHPNVIRIYEIAEDANSMYILQELCEGGELMKFKDEEKHRLTERQIRRMIRDILKGLGHIHNKNIVHKDLKPENILFADKARTVLKIIDFGLGEIFKNQDATTCLLRGSIIYMPPEAFAERTMSLKSDIWAVGCMMFTMITSSYLFEASTAKDYVRQLLTSPLHLGTRARPLISSSGFDVLCRMLERDWKKRGSCPELLSMPWFGMEGEKLPVMISPSMCVNLMEYRQRAKLRNVFVGLMAQDLTLSNGNVGKIATAFNTLDQDNRGVLGVEQVRGALRAAGMPEQEINLVVVKLDVKGTGEVSYREFLAGCYAWRESEMNTLWSAFLKLPRKGGDKVNVSDLKKLLVGKKGLFIDGEVYTMIREIDSDGDGYVTWKDFEDYVWGRNGGKGDSVESQIFNKNRYINCS